MRRWAHDRWLVIQEHIKKPLAEELLFGRLADGGSATIIVKDGDLSFVIDEEEVTEEIKQ